MFRFLIWSAAVGAVIPIVLQVFWALIPSVRLLDTGSKILLQKITLILWPSSFAVLAATSDQTLAGKLFLVAMLLNVILYSSLGVAIYFGLTRSFCQHSAPPPKPMRKNFIAMPPLLKLLTAATIVVPIFCIASIFPHQSIGVFGQQVTASEWWSSGAGLTTFVVGGLMLSAGLLMLRRSYYGRFVYIIGLIAINLSEPFIAYLTESNFPAELSSLLFDLGFTVLVGLYLYKSRAVQHYFIGDSITARSESEGTGQVQ